MYCMKCGRDTDSMIRLLLHMKLRHSDNNED